MRVVVVGAGIVTGAALLLVARPLIRAASVQPAPAPPDAAVVPAAA